MNSMNMKAFLNIINLIQFFFLRPLVCQNGATCTNSVGGFSCICVNGWTGPECSVNIDDCAGAACFNGATCIDRVGAFYCKCTPGKTGKNI